MSGSLLEAVQVVARIAGDVALAHYRTALTVESKGDGSPVTIADREAEEAARAWIAQRFPTDGILGEEFGAVDGTSGRRWLLDPKPDHAESRYVWRSRATACSSGNARAISRLISSRATSAPTSGT